MAVYAAHLTRTLQGTPSIFQVTAQEALGATVKPALRKLFEYLSAVYPNKFGWTVKWYDELFLLMDACLQYHYLKHYAASFSENFYGLVRVPLSSDSEFSSGPRLPVLLERASLLLLVVVPYVRGKLHDIVEKWREEHQDGRLSNSVKSSRLRIAALKVYSAVHLVSVCVRVTQLARYLAGRAATHCAFLGVLGVTLRDAPAQNIDTEQYGWTDLVKYLLKGDFGNATVTFPMVGAAVLGGVEYGAFLIQFLRWWETSAPLAATTLVATCPLPHSESEERASRWRNKCPICLQTWKIPAVLPVSGYVFCYKCISRHLRVNTVCPVTSLPATEQQLVRLYVD